ncbi:PD-(D/E)XK nuclease family protein [Pseudoclavibacter chungangensis]|uniref:PD-(D/E)XK nuclease family protein n=1 Tax=Pseudoclavibacter chungangensis TaxID=587635 RepID=A0A7J5BMC0_9MICO|nr:PD-(D/E)XK nuclease family protein [Pseudoclavibacter chungangensis]KAB1651838.1 PD-(D/E)XK nuclease family protein [Pseudoclavibacter chungangensis]NYJ66499.1 RecB family exonuclease [Pseudoclavibacter chungangensis]
MTSIVPPLTSAPSPRKGPTLPVEGLAFRRDGTLVVTTEQRHKSTYRKGLSVSAAQDLAKCPASWAGKYAVPEVRNLFMPNELGTGAHSVLEELYQLPGAERTRAQVEPLLAGVTETTWSTYCEEQGIDRDPQQEARWFAEVRPLALGDFDLEDPTRVNVFRTEMSERGLVLPNGVPFNGAIDRVDISETTGPAGEERYEVNDYKSGAYRKHNPQFGRDSKADQIRIYAQAVATKLDVERPKRGRLLYTGAGVAQEVDCSDAEVDIALGWFAAQWEDLHRFRDAAMFPAKPSALCSWCPLVNACPVARKINKPNARDQVAKAHTAVELGIPVLPRIAPYVPSHRPAAPRIGEATPSKKEDTVTSTAAVQPAQAQAQAPAPKRRRRTSLSPTRARWCSTSTLGPRPECSGSRRSPTRM